MKKTISLVLAVLMLMGIMSVAAQAEGNIEITKASAADGATSAPVSALLTYTFSEDIADMEAADVSLVVAGQPTELVKEVAVSGNVLKVRASAKLSYGTDYSLDLTKVKAAADENKKLEDGVITFKTKLGTALTMFEEDFEAGVYDTSSFRYTDATYGDGFGQNETGSNNYSYKMTTKEFSNYQAGYKRVFQLYGDVVFGFDIFIDKSTLTTNYYTFTLIGGSGNSTYAFETRRLLGYDKSKDLFGVCFDTNTTGASNTANIVAGLPIKDKSWNNILVKVNGTAQTLSVYVNGSLVKDASGKSVFAFPYVSKTNHKDMSAECPACNVKYMTLADSNYAGGASAEIYYDNLYYRKAQIEAPDSTVLDMTSSTPSFERMVKDTQKEFTLTYNHDINGESLKYVSVNGTAVKSAVANGNTVQITLPDNFGLVEDTEYTFDFAGGEDIYGSAIPQATFRTKTNYNLYKIDFENGLADDDKVWFMRYKTPKQGEEGNKTFHEDTYLGVVNDPDETDKAFKYNKVAGDDIAFQTRYLAQGSSYPELNIKANEVVVGFKFNLESATYSSDVNNYMNMFSAFYKEGSTTGRADNLIRFKHVSDETYEVLCREYKADGSDVFTRTNKTVNYGDWVEFTYEFNFGKEQYCLCIGDTKYGPYEIANKGLLGIDGLAWEAGYLATDYTFYLDDIVVGQKFFADTDYDMGFYNSNGEATDVVDTVKTTYKVTAVNRGKTNDSTKLILVVTDAEENRVSEVRLVDFAEKNEKGEIVIEENFTEDLEGKKIKAFYWQDFGSLSPVLSEARFEAAEVLPVSAE